MEYLFVSHLNLVICCAHRVYTIHVHYTHPSTHIHGSRILMNAYDANNNGGTIIRCANKIIHRILTLFILFSVKLFATEYANGMYMAISRFTLC